MNNPPAHTPEQARGALAAATCYFLWGLVPLYWRQLTEINPVELVAHRQVWSLTLLVGIVALQRGFTAVFKALNSPQAVAVNGLSALLLTANWLCYVWGVNSGYVIETSLGYFLVPLSNVAAGRFILHEHLRRAQIIAIALAAVGVGVMIVQHGHPPWIALAIVGTWGGYSLMRKRSPLPAVTGLTVETLLLIPFAIAFLLWQNHTGAGALGRVDLRTHLLVLSSGVITAVPLLLFAYGARRIRLSTLGLLQYVAPTVQLIIGIWVYHEPFTSARLLSFGFIWAALVLYTADNLWFQRRPTAA
ncbi:MAG: EamA family transporter RarD [Verrucomicrobiota bacterium]